MHKNEWTFWNETVTYWHNKAEFYLELGFTEDMERCLRKAENALSYQYEGREHELGLSRNDFIITGRKGFGVKATIGVQVGGILNA